MKSRTSGGFKWNLAQVVDLNEISHKWWIWLKSRTSCGFNWNLLQVVDLNEISYKWWI